jgi:hypothetical protein
MDNLYIWITLCAMLQVGYDNNNKPDNLSLIYVAVGFVGVLYIAYYVECRKCVGFAQINLRKRKVQGDYCKYLFSMCVILERSSQELYRDILVLALRSLLLEFKSLQAFSILIEPIENLLISFGQSSLK